MAGQQRTANGDDPVVAAIEPALKVGAACGTAGFLFGGTVGILKGSTPFLFATASGLQTFALGSSFWTCRSTFIRTRRDPSALTTSELYQASGISGAVSGGLVALVTRGRRNVIPATLMWGLNGLVGQATYNAMYAKPAVVVEGPKETFWERMAKKSWTPIKYVTNEEYAEMLREKMLKIDVEIAVLDDKIAELKKQQVQEEAAVASAPQTVNSDANP
ncbi:hypothetical protein KC332_g10796 [Hortaea werneckii]|uniref:Uncharacterized protein n=1 Tax=Hortaea werneckii TaxID=91943 RepID=A0A3M7GMU6_HORWE|nr:hypothetical protein KC350_g12552 [Hortaea werneckii]KAI6977203.1 hypothetical protein KC329_g10883 [Hortaea werneckii]KAI7259146.1 hypothetical protein KC335_g11898 [Hortaea werneckii]KAI7399135.1 hypothetical protein KC332_g10796 [Hortaea werneckii]KAI7423443.1 hypothetical protein KC336_g7804 [Hortaea werneckii]